MGWKKEHQPSLRHKKWNMRDRVLNDLLTTNNHVEGFHNKFSTLVGHRNPTVWTWLDAVRANQNLSFNALARHGGGVPGPLSNAQFSESTEHCPCLNILKCVLLVCNYCKFLPIFKSEL